MATVGGVLDRLDRLMPFSKAAAWDPVGLQVGDRDAEIRLAAVCHDVTNQVVRQAVDAGVDLLVAYHPLLFRPTTGLVAGPGPSGRAWSLARAGVSLVVVHTAFDVAADGAADALAAALGILQPGVFGPVWGAESVKVSVFVPPADADEVIAAMAAAGAGVIGAYTHCAFRSTGIGEFVPGVGSAPAVGEVGVRAMVDEVKVEMVAPRAAVDRVASALVAAHPYEEPAYDITGRSGDAGFVGRFGPVDTDFDSLVDVVRSRIGGEIRIGGTAPAGGLVVASVPGSGSGLMRAAASVGANVMVTGDVKHHDAREAIDMGLAVIDPGHAATEKPGVARLYAAVAGEVGAALDLTGVDSDPWGTGMSGPTWKN